MQAIGGIMLGSTNEAKIRGVQDAFEDLREAIEGPDLSRLKSWTCKVESGVREEPLGFPMTIEGAQNRAYAAYRRLVQTANVSDPATVMLGVGVESGFIEISPTSFTLYNFDVCALFDGERYYLGISPGFEYPRQLVQNIFFHRQPFQQARQYITTAADVERQAGIIGVIAGSLTDRPEMTRLSTRLALIRYIRRRDYDGWQA